MLNTIYQETLLIIRKAYPTAMLSHLNENIKTLSMTIVVEGQWSVEIYYKKKNQLFSAIPTILYARNMTRKEYNESNTHTSYEKKQIVLNSLALAVKKHQFSCYILKEPGELVSTGHNPNHVYDMLLHLKKQTNTVEIHGGGIYYSGPYGKYHLKFDAHNPSIYVCRGERSVAELKTKVDIDAYLSKEKIIKEHITLCQKGIEKYAQTLDPTAYFDGSTLYMLGNKLPFSIIEDSEKYKANFNRKTVSAHSLEDLEEKLQIKLLDYFKKTRLSAVTQNQISMFDRNFYTMLNKKLPQEKVSSRISTTLSDDEVMQTLHHAKAEEIQSATLQECQWFLDRQKAFRLNYKLKAAFKLRNLRIFITATKYFIFDDNTVHLKAN